MNELPENLTFKNRSPEFNQADVPSGILGRHMTASNVWGKIIVTEGYLTYRILEPNVQEYLLDKNHAGVVSPQTAHQLEITQPVKFYIEFYANAA